MKVIIISGFLIAGLMFIGVILAAATKPLDSAMRRESDEAQMEYIRKIRKKQTR